MGFVRKPSWERSSTLPASRDCTAAPTSDRSESASVRFYERMLGFRRAADSGSIPSSPAVLMRLDRRAAKLPIGGQRRSRGPERCSIRTPRRGMRKRSSAGCGSLTRPCRPSAALRRHAGAADLRTRPGSTGSRVLRPAKKGSGRPPPAITSPRRARVGRRRDEADRGRIAGSAKPRRRAGRARRIPASMRDGRTRAC